MHHNIHKDFISSSIKDILKNAVYASAGIGNGIQTFPLCDYIMQSVFIKMTGFQEQKMKCICWEIATYDYEYRRDFTKTPLGECSRYNDKNDIYKVLIKQIENYDLDFNEIKNAINKPEILTTTISDIENIFSNTNLLVWSQKYFFDFKTIFNDVRETDFVNEKGSLFSSPLLQKIYKDYLYKHRNRISHNVSSYQQNLPTLKTLIQDDYKYNNYFVYFAILVLIDEIFIQLYNKYLTMLNSI